MPAQAATPPKPIAVQLYTLNALAEQDFAAVLERVGAIGFMGVELAGLHGLAPTEVAHLAAEAGLLIPSAHVPLADDDAFAADLDVHQAMGIETVVVPFLPPKAFADLDAIERSAAAINRANDVARARGIALGYHNHFWELQNVVDGRFALAHLFDRLADDVFAEVDIYWAQVGGADPATLVAELGDRVRLLHVKDGPAGDPAQPMVAVGSGAVAVADVLAAAPSAEWHIVELDRCDTDMVEAVTASYRFLVGEGLSQGRR